MTGTVVRGNNSVKATGAGWTTAGGGVIALETTYKVPDDAVVGSKLDSGAGTTSCSPPAIGTSTRWRLCHGPSAEPGGGRFGQPRRLGIGGQVFGSLTDPQGSISNVVGGILGNVLGNMS